MALGQPHTSLQGIALTFIIVCYAMSTVKKGTQEKAHVVKN